MLRFLIKCKHKLPWAWSVLEWFNGALCRLRYPALSDDLNPLLETESPNGYRLALAAKEDLKDISQMLLAANPDYVRNFHPHGFDYPTLLRLYKSGGFLMMKATQRATGQLVGYFFLRVFCIGKTFQGLFVAQPHTSRGVGRSMWSASATICSCLGLRMMATVAQDNPASLRSMRHGCQVESEQPIGGGFLAFALSKNHISL